MLSGKAFSVQMAKAKPNKHKESNNKNKTKPYLSWPWRIPAQFPPIEKKVLGTRIREKNKYPMSTFLHYITFFIFIQLQVTVTYRERQDTQLTHRHWIVRYLH